MSAVANEIIAQLSMGGPFVRGCLDMGQCFTVSEGLGGCTWPNCLVQTDPNKRGAITIVLNPRDYYTITFVRKSDGKQAIYEDISVEQLVPLLGKIGGAFPDDDGTCDSHSLKFE